MCVDYDAENNLLKNSLLIAVRASPAGLYMLCSLFALQMLSKDFLMLSLTVMGGGGLRWFWMNLGSFALLAASRNPEIDLRLEGRG